MSGLIERLRERYASAPVPPCRVCGAPLSLSSAGGGVLPKYNCSTLGMDMSSEAMAHWSASEHYHQYGDLDVIEATDEITRLTERVAELERDVEKAGAAWPRLIRVHGTNWEPDTLATAKRYIGELESLVAHAQKMADQWRFIASDMGYEPKGHKHAPLSKWLNDRVANFRRAAALSPPNEEQDQGGADG